MIAIATIGATGLYLLFAWLLSAAIGSWLSARKGYGDRLGLTLGLLLTVAGLLIVLVLPGRPGSRWREEGWLPRRRRTAPGAEGVVLDLGSPPARDASAPGDE